MFPHIGNNIGSYSHVDHYVFSCDSDNNNRLHMMNRNMWRDNPGIKAKTKLPQMDSNSSSQAGSKGALF